MSEEGGSRNTRRGVPYVVPPPTLEEALGTSNIQQRYWRFIDPDIWDNEVKAPDNDVSILAATTRVARAVADYTDNGATDEELWGNYVYEFAGWTEEMFKLVHPEYIKVQDNSAGKRGIHGI